MLRRPLRLVRRAWALPRATWGSLARVLPAVLAARVALWVLPYQKVLALFEPVQGRPVRPYPELQQTVRVAAWVGRTFLGDMPCLSQALAARWLLSRDGYHADLKIGARMEDGALAAHAWLERGGFVILGGADSPYKYVTLESLDGAEASPTGAAESVLTQGPA